jgi:L-asparaginase II
MGDWTSSSEVPMNGSTVEIALREGRVHKEFADNPVLVRLRRGAHVESQHRGAWVLVDSAGAVLDGAGEWDFPVFARSSVKSFQALPLLETGAGERFAYSEAELALALASHNAEEQHTSRVRALLERLGLDSCALQCGPQPPGDPAARRALAERGEEPTALHNNCSGKHAGFLALALHLGGGPERYLDPRSESQRLVRKAVLEITGTPTDELGDAIDGCGAPTFRLPLTRIATGFARIANPSGLPPERRRACEAMLRAVEHHPELIAGRHQRICTELARLSGGRLFPKIGGEAVYGVGVRGLDRGLAIKMDGGSARGLHALLVRLLERFELLDADGIRSLETWRARTLMNWGGLPVGSTEVLA